MACWELKHPPLFSRFQFNREYTSHWILVVLRSSARSHTAYFNRQYDERGEMLKLVQTEAQLSAILWLDRKKQRQLIVAAEEAF